MKTRKTLDLDSNLIEKVDMISKQRKRSFTKQLEFIIEEWLQNEEDEFFNYIESKERENEGNKH